MLQTVSNFTCQAGACDGRTLVNSNEPLPKSDRNKASHVRVLEGWPKNYVAQPVCQTCADRGLYSLIGQGEAIHISVDLRKVDPLKMPVYSKYDNNHGIDFKKIDKLKLLSMKLLLGNVSEQEIKNTIEQEAPSYSSNTIQHFTRVQEHVRSGAYK